MSTAIDPRAFGKVAVLMGGRSAEREVSLMSGAGVLQALCSQGVDAHAFDPAEQDLLGLRQQGFDRAFIALHGRYGEDGTVQGLLELLQLPYTGSGVLASSVSMDKVMTKRIWQAEGLPTPAWRQVASMADTEAALAALGAPMIVKPAREGSSLGLTKVTDPGQCAEAYALAARHDPEVLCEQFIAGDEVTCPVLGTGAQAQALPVIHIVAPEGNYDYQHKYFGTETRYLCPAPIDAATTERMQRLSEAAFTALGCEGWARVDILWNGKDSPTLLELNTSPGMTDHSLVPMAAAQAGMDYPALVREILAGARRKLRGAS